MEKFKDLKLKIEMVPQTLWNVNLRYLLTNKKWQEIRQSEFRRIGTHNGYYECEICLARKSSLDCHEIWDYHDNNTIQTFKGLVLLCKKCHLIKHIGFATKLCNEGKMSMKSLVNHFSYVNKVGEDVFEQHFEEEYAKWEQRSEVDWKQNLDYIYGYSNLILFE